MSNNAVPGSPSSPPASGGVRRHHTISSSSRAARAGAKDTISEYEEGENWNEDEVVGEGWVGGVGAVGEKSSLHRQASLPTRYHRAFQGKAPKSGTMTPSKLNSLSAIAGHEGDEEDWELQRAIGAYNAHDDEVIAPPALAQEQPQEDPQAAGSPLSPTAYGNPPQVPSPPPAASGVRRHQSMTYGAARNKQQHLTGLKRSGTLQTPLPHGAAAPQTPSAPESQEPEEEYGYAAEEPGIYDEEYKPYGPMSPIGRSSPWGNNGNNEWRTPGGSISSTGSGAIDDVQRALSALEISNNSYAHGGNAFQGAGQSVHPPRFNPAHPPPQQQPGMRNPIPGNARGPGSDYGGRKTPTGSGNYGGQGWEQQPRERSITPRRSNPNLQFKGGNDIPSVPPIPAQYLQQNNTGGQPRLGMNNTGGATSPVGGQPGPAPSLQGFVNAPIDVPSLIAAKGYNPSNFDIRPQFARYFVIKSYTEDDVHKSLKYEIWSSTDPGNKRLDKAFKETAGRGPIYLFFSVNASGHFCGMAEMLTPVDYTRSSTVWASDKWKGVFKVRWIFVRDIPNVSLRHIKLNNTQERKPVTNSRDTQELLSDAGLEMLRIFATHPARTSLLQDFAFYELQSMQKIQAQQSNTNSTQGSAAVSPIATPAQLASPQLGSTSPNLAQQQASPNLFMQSPYQLPAMNPMLQMQMQMQQMNNMGMGMNGMGLGSPQFGMPQNQAMQQSVMRNPSPGPQGGGQNFMGMPTF
ncbi:YT521-B-like domain-containing protein [Schizophyllum commune]